MAKSVENAELEQNSTADVRASKKNGPVTSHAVVFWCGWFVTFTLSRKCPTKQFC